MCLGEKAASFSQLSHVKTLSTGSIFLISEISSETPKVLGCLSSSWFAMPKALHLGVQVAEAPVVPQKGFCRSHEAPWDLPPRFWMCFFSFAPFPGSHRIIPSGTARPGPSWPSPEQGGGRQLWGLAHQFSWPRLNTTGQYWQIPWTSSWRG